MSQELIEALYPTWDREAVAKGRTALVNKYAHLMDNIKSDKAKLVVAQLCETQDRMASRRMNVLEADLNTGDLPTSVFPNRFAFPMIAQVFPSLVAMQLCDVQPMSLPVGRVYYKNYVYSQTQQGQTSGSLITHEGSYADTAEGGAVPKARIQLTNKDVSVQKKILQAQWSTELAEDAMALGHLNVEQDLLMALAEEIRGEIDWIILNDMVNGATAGNTTYSSAQASGETETEAKHRLYESIVAADVNVQTKRFHPTNYIIGHPQAVQKLRILDTFALSTDAKQSSMQVGVRYFGDFAGQWDVYSAPQFPNTNQLLLGTKGLGYIFAPYIAMELMNPWYDPSVDQWSRNIRTRYGKVLTISDEYATVTLS